MNIIGVIIIITPKGHGFGRTRDIIYIIMAAVKLNLFPVISELKSINLSSFLKNVGKDSELLRKLSIVEMEWKALVHELECLYGKISKEGVSSSVLGDAEKLAVQCKDLTKLVGPLLVEGGSFVPGPIGIVCSLALAIADFAIGNVFGGFMNLLGCIPFAKAGTKALKPLLNTVVRDLLKNPIVVNSIKAAKRAPSCNKITKSVEAETNRIYRHILKNETSLIANETSTVANQSSHITDSFIFRGINEKTAGAGYHIGNYNNYVSVEKMKYSLGTTTANPFVFRYP